MTDYVVLHNPAGDWHEIGKYSARSSRAAITAALEVWNGAPDADQGSFVAVPARSWKPEPVTFETKTKIKFG